MADISKIGSRIRDVRLSRGLSQSALAEKANISLPHVSEIELGKSNMRLSTFIKVAEALQVSADELIRLDVPNVHGLYQTEFASLLDGCSPGEIDSIIKIVKELKSTFRNHKENDAFYMYLYGYSSQQIADTLIALERKSYLGNIKWTAGSVVQILRNERHCGDVVTRKTYTKDYHSHKKSKNYGQRPQSTYRKHHEAIVSRDDFIAVQRMLDNAKYGNKSIC